MCKKFKGKLRAILPSLIGIFLIGISVWIIFYYLIGSATGYFPMSLGEIDILYDCECADSPSVFLELRPIYGTQDISVLLIIQEWKKFLGNCDFIQIRFPGVTNAHNHVLERIFTSRRVAGLSPEGKLRLPRDNAIPLLPSEMEIIRYTMEDIIKIHPKQIKDFTGGIKFTWVNGLKKLSFTELGVFLPFNNNPMSLIRQGVQLYHIKNYTIGLWAPIGYALVSSTSQPLQFQYLYKNKYYQFDINVYKADLIATFENETLSKIKEYCLIFFSILLGIGLALIVEEVIGSIKSR